MKGLPAAASFPRYLATARGSVAEATAGAGLLARHPAALRDWALSCWPAWCVLIAVVALGAWAVPAGAEAVSQWLFPPVRQRQLLGLIYTREADPRSAVAYAVALGAYWSVGVGAVALLLGRSLGRAPERFRRRARELLEQARSRLGSDPLASLKLLERAAALPAEEEVRQAIDATRDELLQRVSGTPQGTLVVDPGQAPPARAPARRPVGEDGRYEIEGELGRGAMGVVYRARDTLLDRPVALKALPGGATASGDLAERFRQEARAAARLAHPGIVHVHDFIASPEGNFIVLELVQGEPLDRILARQAPLTVDAALGYALPLAEALEAAHRGGVIHRDFKPANVLVTPAGQPKITDFGVAKVSGSSLATVAGSLFGSPAYMSPEQAAGGEVDQRSDQYSFGVVLYHMLGGRPPFDGDMTRVLHQQVNEPPPPLETLRPDLPAPLGELVHRLMAKDPGDRFESMGAVAGALRATAGRPGAGGNGSA